MGIAGTGKFSGIDQLADELSERVAIDESYGGGQRRNSTDTADKAKQTIGKARKAIAARASALPRLRASSRGSRANPVGLRRSRGP